jgi:hypothetical protein
VSIGCRGSGRFYNGLADQTHRASAGYLHIGNERILCHCGSALQESDSSSKLDATDFATRAIHWDNGLDALVPDVGMRRSPGVGYGIMKIAKIAFAA